LYPFIVALRIRVEAGRATSIRLDAALSAAQHKVRASFRARVAESDFVFIGQRDIDSPRCRTQAGPARIDVRLVGPNRPFELRVRQVRADDRGLRFGFRAGSGEEFSRGNFCESPSIHLGFFLF
jgi:hypothetical protein